MKKNWKIVLVLIFVIGFTGFSLYLKSPKVLLNKYELNINDKVEVIEQLENNDYQGKISASISDESIYLNVEGKSMQINIESEDLYVAFAPYLNTNHDCYTHSLTGCRGELVNQDILVRIYDQDDELIDEDIHNTGNDGFIGLFLDKGSYYRIEVSYEGKVSSFVVGENTDQTCYTEVELR